MESLRSPHSRALAVLKEQIKVSGITKKLASLKMVLFNVRFTFSIQAIESAIVFFQTHFQLLASLKLVSHRAVCSCRSFTFCSSWQIIMRLVRRLNWNCIARKACSRGGKLRYSIQAFKVANKRGIGSANKRLVWNRFALHTAGRYMYITID